MNDGLFDVPSGAVRPPADSEPKLSDQRRRTRRQAGRLAIGLHPLGLDWQLPLHPDAAPHDDRTAPGLRCGGCRHLEANAWGYLKCWASDGARASHSAATDARRWWPACRDFEPREDST